MRRLQNHFGIASSSVAGADIDELKVKTIFADQGTMHKRMHARAKGRGCRILKPTCHITVVVSDEESK